MRRIGILTSGGDCQALNATMRGVAKSLYNMLDDVEIIGFEDGYKGLISSKKLHKWRLDDRNQSHIRVSCNSDRSHDLGLS